MIRQRLRPERVDFKHRGLHRIAGLSGHFRAEHTRTQSEPDAHHEQLLPRSRQPRVRCEGVIARRSISRAQSNRDTPDRVYCDPCRGSLESARQAAAFLAPLWRRRKANACVQGDPVRDRVHRARPGGGVCAGIHCGCRERYVRRGSAWCDGRGGEPRLDREGPIGCDRRDRPVQDRRSPSWRV